MTREAAGLVIKAEAVSPDGQSISISSNEATGQLRAGLMASPTGQTRWLQDTVWEQTAGAFSPNGRTIVVRTNADGRSDLSLADVATLAERTLPFPPGVNIVGHNANHGRQTGGCWCCATAATPLPTIGRSTLRRAPRSN